MFSLAFLDVWQMLKPVPLEIRKLELQILTVAIAVDCISLFSKYVGKF